MFLDSLIDLRHHGIPLIKCDCAVRVEKEAIAGRRVELRKLVLCDIMRNTFGF